LKESVAIALDQAPQHHSALVQDFMVALGGILGILSMDQLVI
jgi:hypothetical protein